jgi:diguanylate cyclase (GGDEF)-like protein
MARASRSMRPSLRDELELGGTLIAAAYAAVAVAGPAFYPAIYLLMAVLVSSLPTRAGIALLALALAFDGVWAWQGPEATWSGFLGRAAFLILFALLYHLLIAARLAMAKKAEADAVKNRIRQVEESARSFRLSEPESRGAGGDDKWLLASVKEVEGALGAALGIAELSLKTHVAAVFLLSDDGRHLLLHGSRGPAETALKERLSAAEGPLAGALRGASAVRLHSPAGLRGVTYYESGNVPVGSLLAVPLAGPHGPARGVVVADRVDAEPFGEQDEKLLKLVADEVSRAIEVERVMGYIRKSSEEKERFFKAIEELNRAQNPDQVFVAVIDSARQLSALDFCAVTLVREEEGRKVHQVARAWGLVPSRPLQNLCFEDNHGLVANVVRYGAPLPGRELSAMERQIIFDEESEVRGLAALKIFPLLAGGRVVGTLVAGARKRGALSTEAQRMLEVVAISAAQAVLRAQLFEQMATMATTDGLTGLFNHRSFFAKADDMLAHARRYGRKCSVILCDIDHFKSINDTHGHPAGDVVLKGVARILSQKARDTDVVARYGGEEFAILMPETDAKGALVIAERIREGVRSASFATEVGMLSVTLSLGIATFPDHGKDRQALIDLADQCLYQAKRGGRNRAVAASEQTQLKAG